MNLNSCPGFGSVTTALTLELRDQESPIVRTRAKAPDRVLSQMGGRSQAKTGA